MTQPLALIIEDELDLSGIFIAALKSAGFKTEALFDGATALLYLETHETPPDLIVLDLHLPNVSGDELLQFIGNDDRYRNTRVMLVTADRHLGDMIRQDADLLLLKPISVVQMKTLAIRLLRTPEVV